MRGCRSGIAGLDADERVRGSSTFRIKHTVPTPFTRSVFRDIRGGLKTNAQLVHVGGVPLFTVNPYKTLGYDEVSLRLLNGGGHGSRFVALALFHAIARIIFCAAVDDLAVAVVIDDARLGGRRFSGHVTSKLPGESHAVWAARSMPAVLTDYYGVVVGGRRRTIVVCGSDG